MNQISLENFRCFREKQSVCLAPLTLLVGENSTGKTSFLALLRALWDAAYGRTIPDFKEAPYDLGSFDEIAHYRGGRAGRATEFKAGFDALTRASPRRKRAIRSRARSHRFEITFGLQGTAPVPTRTQFAHDDLRVTGHLEEDLSQKVRFQTSNGEWLRTVATQNPARLGVQSLWMPPSFLPRAWDLATGHT